MWSQIEKNRQSHDEKVAENNEDDKDTKYEDDEETENMEDNKETQNGRWFHDTQLRKDLIVAAKAKCLNIIVQG